MTDVAHLPGFSRRNGTLYCEALAVRNLAERFGTPLYLYSRQGLETAAADWPKRSGSPPISPSVSILMWTPKPTPISRPD